MKTNTLMAGVTGQATLPEPAVKRTEQMLHALSYRRLMVAMAGSPSRLGRSATHPIGASLFLALGYMVLCSAYIVFSSRVAARAAWSIDQLRDIELLKGVAFVMITGAAFFGFAAFLLKRIALQQQHLALIFQGVSDCLFLLQIEANDGYRFLCVNAAFLKVTGLTREQVVGKRIEEVLPGTSHARVRGKFQEAIRERQTVSWEGSAAYPAGPRVGEVTLTPLADQTGTPVQLAGVVRDITDRKLAEDEIRRLNETLEQRVVARTAELAAANQELEAFSYSVSHDLRAPLRHVLGFVRLLENDAGPKLSETSRQYLTTISHAAERMGDLIDDLLAFSRLGRSAMHTTVVNLDQLVQETVSDFQRETKERHLAWEIKPLPVVRADRALLRVVLVNLIANAVKFTGPRPQAKIEIGCLPDRQGETVIFIRDNGVGFDPQYTDRLFGVFQRLHTGTQFEGTGIGLATVRRIVQRHGGRTWAEGAVDGGATFYFSIPNQSLITEF